MFPATNNRRGWMVARRTGDVITHKRLLAPTNEPDTARSEAEAMFPDLRVWMAGDPNPPWKDAA